MVRGPGYVDDVAAPTCVLVGVDSSAESLAALDLALQLAEPLRARVVAVHAIGLLEEGGYRAAPDLDGIVERARAAVGSPASLVVDRLAEDGVPSDVLLRVAEREGAGLIVVGSRGLGGALHELGSTSGALVTISTVPVLVVPHDRS
jgi:nucleotide-binding universal stress UspA family protein